MRLVCFYKLKFGVKYFKIEFGAFFKSNGVIFSFKKVWCTILYNLVQSCIQFYTQFQSGKVYLKFDDFFCLFVWIYCKSCELIPRFTSMGNYLLEKPGRQVVSVLLSTKEDGKQNEMKWKGKRGFKKMWQ